MNNSDTSHYENYELPQGWAYATMSDICTKIVDGDHNPPIAQKAESEYIMISSKNVVNDSIIHLDDVRHLSRADFELSNARTQVSKGDVLFTSVASLGRTCIYDLDYPITFQRSVTVICTKIFNRYLKLFLDSPLYQNYVGENARGTAQKGFYINQISDSWVPIPPLNEQIRIVEKAQSLLDIVQIINYSKEETSNNIIALKSKILDLAISGKLVRQDKSDEPAIELLKRINPQYQPADNRHYENIELSIPETWCWATIGDVFKHNTGKALNSSNHSGIMMDYITTSNLYWDRFDLSTVKQMPFTEKDLEKCTVTKGDLLICEGGDVGRSAIWNYNYDIRIQNHIHRLRGKANICVRYFFYVFMLYKQRNYIGGKGVAIQGLSSRDLNRLVIPLPPLNEQYRIAKSVDNLFSTIDNILLEL